MVMDVMKGEITVERSNPGNPHSGKVLAIVFPHSDDFSRGGHILHSQKHISGQTIKKSCRPVGIGGNLPSWLMGNPSIQ